MQPRRHRGPILVVALAAAWLAALLPGAATAAPAVEPTVTSFSLSGTPFAPSFAPLPTKVTIRLVLARRARVTLTIRKPGGRRVKRLAADVRLPAGTHTWTWAGRNAAGRYARDGRYVARMVVRDAGGVTRVERPLRKGLPQIYPANPGALAVLVDPGHGGRYPGAVRDGYAEKDFNVDISLQLQALLERAGVEVVMTRTTDRALDEPRTDHNGDGIRNRYDDDLLRNDTANLARVDAGVHVHNNASSDPTAHGTEAYSNGDRSFAPSATVLADLILREEVEALEAYRSAEFAPVNAGVYSGWYYYLGPYDPPFLPRPALGVSVLSESLYVSNPADLEALKRAEVRLSIAAAIYIGLAEYLNTREHGAGYQLTSAAPGSAVGSSSLNYRLRVTNRGNAATDGWTLELASVPAVPVYDGSGAHGTPIGSVVVPDGVQPGQSVELEVTAQAPAGAGDWLVKAGVRLEDGSYLSDRGVIALQIPLTTTAP